MKTQLMGSGIPSPWPQDFRPAIAVAIPIDPKANTAGYQNVRAGDPEPVRP